MTKAKGQIPSSTRSAPSAPSIASVTAITANRPFNNGAMEIVFNPVTFDGKLPPVSYRVYSSDGQILSSTSTTIVVEGLQGGTSYTFTGNAYNAMGPSATVGPTAGVNAGTVPSTPSITTAQFSATIPYGNAPQFVVGWNNSSSGGSSILRYEYSTDNGTNWRSFGVAASPGSTTVQSNGSNFVAGSDYSVLIRAVNGNGNSLPYTDGLLYRARTVPQAPTSVTATRLSNTSVRLVWTAGNNGGNTLTSIMINSTPAANAPGYTYTNTDVDGSIDITGTFTLGQSYTFTINVTSAAGTSLGATSNSIIPNPNVAPNFPTPNFPTPNFAPNFPTPSFPTPNFPTPNFAPNFPTPSFPTPNFPTPNFPTPNFPTPNFPTPNFPTPNFPTPNFPVPCDCYSPCCCGGVPGCCGGTYFC